ACRPSSRWPTAEGRRRRRRPRPPPGRRRRPPTGTRSRGGRPVPPTTGWPPPAGRGRGRTRRPSARTGPRPRRPGGRGRRRGRPPRLPGGGVEPAGGGQRAPVVAADLEPAGVPVVAAAAEQGQRVVVVPGRLRPAEQEAHRRRVVVAHDRAGLAGEVGEGGEH